MMHRQQLLSSLDSQALRKFKAVHCNYQDPKCFVVMEAQTSL